ncbi:hypothetical protein FE257_010256 [Aspergillus nanangensis]|uniref:FAD dependent oxidoreductase domain-containing protein n=1 Tax=Aspergillus nanangensis TaxID=2582783 RepID=A0AAD4CJ58_ASPNN|nr:hypothetical protein FE257_010256 [Aspergillus nanangensis]
MSSSFENIYEPGVVDPGIPVPNSTASYWLSQPSKIHKIQSPWIDTADVVVIGSGITATSIAKTLLAKKPGLQVVLVEARDLCSGATGRNGGHIKNMSFEMWIERKEKYGVQEAIRWTQFEQSHLPTLTSCIQTNNIECDLRIHDGVDAYYDASQFQKAVDAIADMKKHAPELAETYTIYDQKEALAKLKCGPTCIGAISSPAASLWPYKFVSSLIGQMVEKDGLHVQTQTRVSKVSERDNYATVETNRGQIRATSVIHATNAYMGHLLAELRPFISPVRGNVTRQRSPPGFALEKSFWLRHGTKDYDYLIQTPSSEFIIGRANTGRRAVGDDSAIDTGPHAHLGGILPLVLEFPSPTLPRRTEVTHAWSGILGFTEDANPFIGSLSLFGKKHQWVCGGYHGVGMVKAFLSGQILVSLLLGEKKPFEYPESALLSERRLASLKSGLRSSRL